MPGPCVLCPLEALQGPGKLTFALLIMMVLPDLLGILATTSGASARDTVRTRSLSLWPGIASGTDQRKPRKGLNECMRTYGEKKKILCGEEKKSHQADA